MKGGPAVTETTYYYQYGSGAVAARTITTSRVEEAPELPPGAVEITQAEYTAACEGIRADNVAEVDQARGLEEERSRADYDALRAAGIPEGTARRMSGYTGTGGA